ncbi:hypothetical protein [Halodesulfovibrio spirochaetisodalis]|uniref:hypothetical protein n=1 Tax=Halodesulfovibrio spirochaetisodalis TaxID=1560234 RepID=UPI000AF2101E|nr:hypothetical protein [Halodesulfovibrio spirochaetisodalis]
MPIVTQRALLSLLRFAGALLVLGLLLISFSGGENFMQSSERSSNRSTHKDFQHSKQASPDHLQQGTSSTMQKKESGHDMSTTHGDMSTTQHEETILQDGAVDHSESLRTTPEPVAK